MKVLELLYQEGPLEERYSLQGRKCEECGASVRPVLITPTHSKDYRNPHIAQIWYRAERLLREADRAIIVGYSLPEDDVDVIYLLKRGLGRLDPQQITVVEYDISQRALEEHPVGLRYRTLFGSEVDWRTEGFGRWLDLHEQHGVSPVDGPLPR